MTILLIESVQVLSDRARDMLHTDGFDTILAVNARDAIEIIAKPRAKFGLAVVNVSAIFLDTMDFFGHYLHNPTVANIPVILAAEDASDPRLGRYAGMIGAEFALSLPYQREEMRTMIAQCYPNLKNYLRAAASVMRDFQLTLQGFQELLADFIRLVQGDIDRLTAQPRSETAVLVMNNLMDGVSMMGTQLLRETLSKIKSQPTPSAMALLDVLRQLLGCLLEAKAHYTENPPLELAPLVNSMSETTRLLVEAQGKVSGAKKKFAKLMAAAKAGSPIDMVRVGLALMRGVGCVANETEGQKWVDQAAATKDPTSLTHAALLTISAPGDIPQEEWQKGFAKFTEAARLGSPEAKYWRGQMLRHGQTDAEEGLMFLSLARQGDAEAQNRLGTLYDRGEFFPRDAEEALYWLEQAAKQGHSEAQFRLRVLEQLPPPPKTPPPAPATPPPAPAPAPAPETPAASAPATETEVQAPAPASGPPPSSDMQALQAAAARGEAEAQCQLGIAYVKGQGIAPDDTEALKWLKLAAEQHHPKAICKLALLTISAPTIVEPEVWQQAYSQFTEAARRGNEEALYWRSQMLAHGLSEAERGLGFVGRARRGDPNAQYRFGLIYDGGSQIPRDIEEAKYWFAAAAQSGHVDAGARMAQLGST